MAHAALPAQWHDAGVGFFNTFVNHAGWHMRHGWHIGMAGTLAPLADTRTTKVPPPCHAHAQCQATQSQLADVYGASLRCRVCPDVDYGQGYG